MKTRLVRIAKWFGYPLFYLMCLSLFGYVTFPYDKLRDRIVAEFEHRAKPGQRLEIASLTGYWVSGVALTGVKLTMPSDDAAAAAKKVTDDGAAGPKESVITIDEAHARVQILPLLIGRVRLDFWASTLGGEITGSAPLAGAGDIALELSKIDLSKVEPIAQTIGIPLKGSASGALKLTLESGKLSKANGTVDLHVSDVAVGDGKSKIAGLLELPIAKLGTLTFTAEAKDGVVKIGKLTANGTDLELVGDGRITLRDPWTESLSDLMVRFKFTDAYRTKSDTTKSILGDPASSVPPLMEMTVPNMKKAKRADGFYGFHVYGPLKALKFDPSAVDPTPLPAPAAKPAKPTPPSKPLDLPKAPEPPKAVDPPKPPDAPRDPRLSPLGLPLGPSQLPPGTPTTPPPPIPPVPVPVPRVNPNAPPPPPPPPAQPAAPAPTAEAPAMEGQPVDPNAPAPPPTE